MNQSVVATTPSAMVAAQAKLVGWIDGKLAAVEGEFATNEAMLAQLRLARMATNHAERALDNLRRRQRFYEKVKAALEAGYYIIPPFDCQVFAIRTDRDAPPDQVSRVRNPENNAKVPALPPGRGDYVNPVPEREWRTSGQEKRGEQMVEVDYFADTGWKEVEFPVRAMKPELIESAAHAMKLKIFDTLGIAPYYRQADPIIVGTIKHWKSNRSPLTFFVAWWLDEEDL